MKRTPLKRRMPMRRTAIKRSGGKKTKEWEAVRANLKLQFEAMGITSCEIGAYLYAHKVTDGIRCWRDNALSFAHLRKRRHLAEGELGSIDHVVLCCTPHHDFYERKGEAEMRAFLERVIEWRKGLVERA